MYKVCTNRITSDMSFIIRVHERAFFLHYPGINHAWLDHKYSLLQE